MSRKGPTPNPLLLPPLGPLRAFEAAGRIGSMRKAADELGLSHTVVSRHIRTLEDWMGRKLVAAGPRGIQLTAEGRMLHEAATRAFQFISNATQDVRVTRRLDSLRIWCIPGLAARWLAPRLPLLEEMLAEADIVLRSTDMAPDFGLDEADLAIGFADPSDLPASAVLLSEPAMFPVATPQLLERLGRPANLDELATWPLIHESSHQQWHAWFEGVGVPLSQPLKGVRLWDASLAFDATLAGRGAMLTSRTLAARELADRRLVRLFDAEVRLGCYFYTVAPKRRGNSALVRFATWMKGELQRAEASPGVSD